MIDLKADAERLLVERARAGDRTAFGALVERYSVPLAAFARRWVDRGEAQDAAHDVVQTTFAQALSSIPALHDACAFRGWLYGIALNECRRRRRSAGRLRRALAGLTDVLLGRGPVLPAEPADPEEAEAVRTAVARLPERQRATVELRMWEGLSCAEAAVALGCTEGTIKANFHHALKKLRVDLEGHAS